MTGDSSKRPGLEAAIGRVRSAADRIERRAALLLAATLDRDDAALREGAPLPPGWHWLYFLDAPLTGQLGEDGRTVPGGFLPDTGLPRRMWAGGTIDFDAPLPLGSEATCEARIDNIEAKQGRSGPLVFVTTRHVISSGGRRAVEERRDLVFRGLPGEDEPQRREQAPGCGTWRRVVTPDPVLLFRFSALTFNAHRIHYDVDYCRAVEGYPTLVVHGPLLALLMLDLVARERPDGVVRSFAYRVLAPLYSGSPFAVCGCEREGGAELWVEGPDGTLATKGRVAFRGGLSASPPAVLLPRP